MPSRERAARGGGPRLSRVQSPERGPHGIPGAQHARGISLPHQTTARGTQTPTDRSPWGTRCPQANTAQVIPTVTRGPRVQCQERASASAPGTGQHLAPRHPRAQVIPPWNERRRNLLSFLPSGQAGTAGAQQGGTSHERGKTNGQGDRGQVSGSQEALRHLGERPGPQPSAAVTSGPPQVWKDSGTHRPAGCPAPASERPGVGPRRVHRPQGLGLGWAGSLNCF